MQISRYAFISRLLRFGVPALIVLLAVLARVIPGARTIDDAYITFRYARHLLAGHGAVFNPGEMVLGTTTPLYMGLMAVLGALSGGAEAPFPLLAWGVNALADAGTALLLWRWGKRLGAEPAGVAAALVWAVAPYSVTFAVGGLETSLYVLLLTGCAYAAFTRRRRWAAGLAALGLLTRPDALILLGPLALERLYAAIWKKERISAGEMILAGAPLLAWGVFATLTYGSPLPHSIAAKIAAYRLGAGEALIRLVQHYATPFLEYNLMPTPLAVGVGLVLYPFLALVGTRRALKAEGARLLPWLLYPWLYLVTFALPNPLIFRWYLTPPLPAYFLVILLGADVLLQNLAQWVGQRRAKARRWVAGMGLAVLLVLPVGFSLAEWTWVPDHGPQQPAPEMAWFKLELLYRQAAERLAGQVNADSVLAAGDVGVLGYVTGARILDTVGLNSPVSTGYYPLPPEAYEINYAIPTALILDEAPDFIVILEVYGRRTLLVDAEFARRYHLVESMPTDIYGSRGMLIFARK